jgi:sulfide dehydrogenase cytochrome subunit
MKKLFYTNLNAVTRGALLALLSGGLAVLAFAANESASKVPQALVNKAQVATNNIAVSGEAMAHTCASCHGTLGRLGDESFMPLAGMPVRQFTSSMVDFREGKRPSTLMGHVANGFTDADIRAMADFFAAVKPEGNQP